MFKSNISKFEIIRCKTQQKNCKSQTTRKKVKIDHTVNLMQKPMVGYVVSFFEETMILPVISLELSMKT